MAPRAKKQDAEGFRLAPAEMLIPSPRNPRVFRHDEAFYELVSSVRRLGILEPVLVRPLTLERAREIAPALVSERADAGPYYEILAGERRWRASVCATVADVPCIVRDLDDHAALEVTVTENMHRADLSPLEEASGVASMLSGGWTVEQAANQLGKSAKWVLRRASLTSLSPGWKEAVATVEAFAGWSASHLELVARFPRETQDAMLADLTQQHWRVPKTAADLRTYTDRHLMRMSAAPWDLEDAELVPQAGACRTCPSRSGCTPDLFDTAAPTPGVCRECGVLEEDVEAVGGWADDGRTLCVECRTDGEVCGPGGADEDHCLNRACWKAKDAAHAARIVATVREEHGADVVLWQSNAAHVSESVREAAGAVLWSYEAKPVSEPGRDTVLGFDLATMRPVHLRLEKHTPKAKEAAKKAATPAQQLKAKREHLEKLRGRMVCGYLREWLGSGEPVLGSDKSVAALALTFGTNANEKVKMARRDPWKNLEGLKKVGAADVHGRLLKEVLPVLSARLLCEDQPALEEARNVAELFGIELEPLWERARKERPEPKSWAKAAEAKKAKKGKGVRG